MVAIKGLVGLRPSAEAAPRIVCPPYDVIKEGTALERCLQDRPESVYHAILGDDPAKHLAGLREKGQLVEDNEAAFYVYEQRWGDGQERTGVFIAAEVSDYAEKQIIRHEKTFDEKVRGRIALAKESGHNIGPIFLLTRAKLRSLFADVKSETPLYDFQSDFGGGTDLHEVHHRVWRVSEESNAGAALIAAFAEHPLYIADGHHRYHAALRGNQTHVLAYVTEEAKILAYDRVIKGTTSFADIKDKLNLEPCDSFATPAKHQFCIYSGGQSYLLKAQEVPEDVVGRLDCAILERELYPHLGMAHEHIQDGKHFDYYPESQLDAMAAAVDDGRYDLAVALAPVAIDELIAVADAGLENSDIVMPEKSTFFSPKILTGLVLYRHDYK